MHLPKALFQETIKARDNYYCAVINLGLQATPAIQNGKENEMIILYFIITGWF